MSDASYPPPPSPGPPYGASYGPSYDAHAAPAPQGNGQAVAAFVLGVIALVVAAVPLVGVVGVVLALIGIGLGIAGLARARRVGRGAHLAGWGIGLSVVALAVCAVVSYYTLRYLGDLLDFVDPPAPSAEIGEEFETDGGDLVVTVTSLECRPEEDECTFTFQAANHGERRIDLDDITVKSVVDGEWDSASVSDPSRSSYGAYLEVGESKSLTGSVLVHSGEHLDGIVFDANDASSHSAVVVDAGDASSSR